MEVDPSHRGDPLSRAQQAQQIRYVARRIRSRQQEVEETLHDQEISLDPDTQPYVDYLAQCNKELKKLANAGERLARAVEDGTNT